MFTSLAPSPIAKVTFPFVLRRMNYTTSAFYAGEDLYIITEGAERRS